MFFSWSKKSLIFDENKTESPSLLAVLSLVDLVNKFTLNGSIIIIKIVFVITKVICNFGTSKYSNIVVTNLVYNKDKSI